MYFILVFIPIPLNSIKTQMIQLVNKKILHKLISGEKNLIKEEKTKNICAAWK